MIAITIKTSTKLASFLDIITRSLSVRDGHSARDMPFNGGQLQTGPL